MTNKVEGMPAKPKIPNEHATEINTTRIPPIANVTLESTWRKNLFLKFIHLNLTIEDFD